MRSRSIPLVLAVAALASGCLLGRWRPGGSAERPAAETADATTPMTEEVELPGATATPTSITATPPTSTATSNPTPLPTPDDEAAHPESFDGAQDKLRSGAPALERSRGADLPAPLPPPPEPPPFADLSDPLELLWGHRLEFAPGGEPLITIRLMEGQRAVTFRPRGPARVLLRGGATVEVPAGARLTVRPRDAVPAVTAWYPLLAEAPVSARDGLAAERARLEGHGLHLSSRVVGGVYGIAGRVIDNRRELLLSDGGGGQEEARAAADDLRARGLARPALHGEVVRRPAGALVLEADGGAPLGEADAALTVLVEGDAGFVVEGVEHEQGPSARAREDRAYRGRLYVTLDATGALAAVHGVPLEELLRGLVPSEMPGSSHLEALKAQAVTARSNVLAQVGARHLTDPFMICAEVHCQAYRGDGARVARTDAAVAATRGEALFGKVDRTLVDAVYSALCGGHSEDNDQVWGNTPSSSLRGRPDLPAPEAARWTGGLSDEARLRVFLGEPSRAWCQRAAGARRDRFRWERRFEPAELDAILASLGVGHVTGLAVIARGVSGRARLLRVDGDLASAEVAGELRIRRLLRNLPSSMFVLERDGAATVLRGGGWGHGAGMCQWGAVGRAEAGQGYRDILRAYYSGAEVARVY
jgi:stage II sporulation protein D